MLRMVMQKTERAWGWNWFCSPCNWQPLALRTTQMVWPHVDTLPGFPAVAVIEPPYQNWMVYLYTYFVVRQVNSYLSKTSDLSFLVTAANYLAFNSVIFNLFKGQISLSKTHMLPKGKKKYFWQSALSLWTVVLLFTPSSVLNNWKVHFFRESVPVPSRQN